VVFSINLFLWFKHDLFMFQLLMVAVGLAAKELITWNKNGRRAHIFNPSSLPLALASMALIVTSSTDLTYGQQIATTLEIPPHIVVWIFVIAVPGQLLFGVTTMTMSAVLTLYGLSHLYFLTTGTYLFVDSYIPAAVFLGMHLLFTDPSTSPRTEAGRAIFGMLYAMSIAFLYLSLESTGAPTFYDKLLAVPLLNLLIQSIDRWTTRRRAGDALRWWPAVGTQRRRLAYVVVWAIAFGLINKVEGVGDIRHARAVPLWQRACDEGRERACRVLATILTRGCVEGSPWACNELGILSAAGHGSNAPPAGVSFRRACERGQAAACENGETYKAGQKGWQRASPETVDYAILVQESANRDVRVPFALSVLDAACEEGWGMACYRAADADAPPNGRRDDAQNVWKYLRRACELGVGEACGRLVGDPSKTGPVSRDNVAPPRHASGLSP
jgi:TPR repeat protein